MMPRRIRVSRWETSDGKRFDDQAAANSREKVIRLGEAIRQATYAKHGESPSTDWCEDVADHILAHAETDGLIIALRPTAKESKT